MLSSIIKQFEPPFQARLLLNLKRRFKYEIETIFK